MVLSIRVGNIHTTGRAAEIVAFSAIHSMKYELFDEHEV